MAWKSFAKSTHISSAVVRVKQGNERYKRCKFPRWTFTGLKMRHSVFMFMFLIFLLTQASLCHCHECGTYSSRLHSCLLCVYFGCYTGNRHIHHHAQSTGHSLGTELGNSFFMLRYYMPSAVAFTVLLFSCAVFSFGPNAWRSLLLRVQRQCLRFRFGESWCGASR